MSGVSKMTEGNMSGREFVRIPVGRNFQLTGSCFNILKRIVRKIGLKNFFCIHCERGLEYIE